MKNEKNDEKAFPEALQCLSIKGFIVSGAILALMLITLFWQKPPLKDALIFGAAVLLVVGYVVYNALHLRREWNDGSIVGHIAICRAVRSRKWPRDSKQVIFVTEDEEKPETLTFELPDRRNKDLYLGFHYVVYVRTAAPDHLLAYQEIWSPSDTESVE